MQRYTITTLGLLRIGDRFCYPGKTDVWQVVDVRKTIVGINQFDANGKKLHPWSVSKAAKTVVCFLRHTLKEHGDECTIADLVAGDVFTTKQNIVFEYRLLKRDFITRVSLAEAIDGSGQTEFTATHKVVYIRKSVEA